LKVPSQQEIEVVDQDKSALLQEADQQDLNQIRKTVSRDLQSLDQNLVRLEAQKLETALAVDKAKAKA
jgi:hypothetical protein